MWVPAGRGGTGTPEHDAPGDMAMGIRTASVEVSWSRTRSRGGRVRGRGDRRVQGKRSAAERGDVR